MSGSVSAVIVNYNARDHLIACVESLRAEGVTDIVVADNASVDGSEAAMVAADPDVTYVQTGNNLGYGTGMNRGAAAADRSAAYLLVLNPDTVVQPGAVKALVDALEAAPRRGIVGPRIEDLDGRLYPSPRAFPRMTDAIGHAALGLIAPRNRFTRRYRMLEWDRASTADVDWVSGSCFLARREAWDDVGGFDESYFMYAEDLDLCWRLKRCGWTVCFEPSATVMHVQGVSAGRHPYRMILEHHRALLRFAARTTEGPARAVLPLVAVGLLARVPLAWLHRVLVGGRVK